MDNILAFTFLKKRFFYYGIACLCPMIVFKKRMVNVKKKSVEVITISRGHPLKERVFLMGHLNIWRSLVMKEVLSKEIW